MRRPWTRGFALASLIAAAACGTIVFGDGGDGQEGRTALLRDVTFEEAWEAAIESFADLRLPIDEIDRSSGVITTDWELIAEPQEAMDCPSEADRNAEGRFNVFVREVPEGVRVTVNASFRAEDDTGRRVICRSEGEFEEDFVLLIRERA